MQSWISAPGDGQRIELPPLGVTITVRVPAAATDDRLFVFEDQTDPGGGPPLHVHHHQSELFRGLEGEYVLQVGERRVPLLPGTVAIVPPGVPHAFRNVGTTRGRLHVSLDPAIGGEAFFLALAEILAAGPPVPDRLAPLLDRFGFEVVGPPLPA